MASTEGVNIVISGDSSQAVNEVEKVSKAIDGVKGTSIKITADSSQAQGEVNKVADTAQSINDSHIEITADSSQAVDETEKASSAMENITDAHSEITADASQAVDEANKVADAENALNDAHVDITADSSQAVSEAEKASNAVEHIGDAHSNITADGSQAVDEAGKVANAEESIRDAHSTITADGSQAINEAKNVITVIDKIDGRAAKLVIQANAKKAIGEVMSLQDVINSINRQIKLEFSDADIKRQLQNVLDFRAKNAFSVKFKEGLKDFSKAADDFGKKLEVGFGKIFKSITAGAMSVAGTLSMITKSALSIGGGFESQITNVKVISGATEQELDMLIKKAREMGATLPITAKDAATAMQLLAQRGTQAKDILATVSEVANLTISQGVDMGSAADLLGSTMTNFGIAVNDASKITAIFNNACNQSALSMGKLIEAMKYVGPAAGAVDMELTEAVSAMEAIANAGLTGEMTGTGLAMVLSKLAQKSLIAGVQTKELDGSLRPLKDIFTELKAAGFSLVDAIEAFGQRGSKAALALVRNSDKLAENEERLKNWGSTQAAVDAKAKTFTNTMAALRSAVEEFHIEIFEQIKDQSKEAVGGLAELTRAFSKWVGESQIAGKTLNAFLQGLGFNIPSGDDFKRLLEQFDVQAFVDRIKEFGSTLKGIGESIAGMFDKIKTPLLWLIEHLDTFAQISFWGWILGKGLQVPAAVLGIASSIKILTGSFAGLIGLSWAKIAPLFLNPVGAIAGFALVGAGVAAFAASQMNAERENLQKAIDREKQFLAEQAKADFSLPVDIQFDLKTGFEKLPESWTKASDNVRQEANDFSKGLQEIFRVKLVAALDFVARKFPELADEIKNLGTISDSTLRQISNALHGDEAAFESLPEPLKKATEHINALDSGLNKLGIDFYGISQKYREFKQEIEKPIKKDEASAFFEELNANIKNIVGGLSSEIERANKFLAGSDGQLVAQVSLSQAHKKLEGFIKTVSEKYALPEDIVKASLINRLNDFAKAGNETAKSLADGFSGAGNALDGFLSNAQEAIKYLEVSPDKFMPALNKMMAGIQKIDPITGKVTEQFKKAYDALKQWSNITFGQLENRISKIRKAVEGGFMDKSVLEKELKRVKPQIMLEVVKNLEPQRGQFRNERDYQSVVASEFMSKINDMFGDTGINAMSTIFNGKTGAEMGRSILNEIERGLSKSNGDLLSSPSATVKINGLDMFTHGLESISTLPKNISEAVNPYVLKLEQLNSPQGSPHSAVKDYSAEIANVVREIQSLSSNIQSLSKSTTDNTSVMTQLNGVFSAANGNSQTQNNANDFSALNIAVQGLSVTLNNIQGIQQANSSAFSEVINAVRSVENALKSINAGNNYDIDINQQGFMIEKKSDADMLARSTVSALRAGIGNGVI